MKHTFRFSAILILTIPILLLTACQKDDDPVIPNEEELITTLILTMAPSGGGDPVIWSFRDLDGDGGQNPVIVTEPLSVNTEYSTTVQLLNETETPAEDITEEVRMEQEEHQFFYVASAGTDLIAVYNDQDANGNPVGLQTTISTGTAGSGTLTVTLIHLPDKTAPGVAVGLPDQAGGETDIEVVFDVEIIQ